MSERIHIVILFHDDGIIADIVGLRDLERALDLERKLKADFGERLVTRTFIDVDELPEYFGLRNKSQCSQCGSEFSLGYDGIQLPGEPPLCDACAGVQRCAECGAMLTNGHCANSCE